MRFEQFIKHRQYLLNVSANTIRWYRHASKWLPPGEPDRRSFECYSSANAGVRFEADRLQRGSTGHQRLSSLVK
jgi:hypothetical protein